MIAAMTVIPETGPDVADPTVLHALARQQARRAAAQWLTADQTALVGQQMVGLIARYRRMRRRSSTWAEAVAGTDPELCEPMTSSRRGGRWVRGCGGVSCGYG
jgi:hypothetical protein